MRTKPLSSRSGDSKPQKNPDDDDWSKGCAVERSQTQRQSQAKGPVLSPERLPVVFVDVEPDRASQLVWLSEELRVTWLLEQSLSWSCVEDESVVERELWNQRDELVFLTEAQLVDSRTGRLLGRVDAPFESEVLDRKVYAVSMYDCVMEEDRTILIAQLPQELLKGRNVGLKTLQTLPSIKEMGAQQEQGGLNLGLVDGGATHPLRQGTQDELRNAKLVSVQLATGTTQLRLTETGVLLSKGPAMPIIPMGALTSELGCDMSWSGDRCSLKHPKRGKLRVIMKDYCPHLRSDTLLELMAELEEVGSLKAQEQARLRMASLVEANETTLERAWNDLKESLQGTSESSSQEADPTSALFARLLALAPQVPAETLACAWSEGS